MSATELRDWFITPVSDHVAHLCDPISLLLFDECTWSCVCFYVADMVRAHLHRGIPINHQSCIHSESFHMPHVCAWKDYCLALLFLSSSQMKLSTSTFSPQARDPISTPTGCRRLPTLRCSLCCEPTTRSTHRIGLLV